ncbi:hypothetical protein [Dolichospermum sp. UHCC 0259]|uniref:hypothetical protein n=1 Tax=Dolichospermum sp. UHCC 0259 TaxID=2590010 RepID=UPI001445BFB9|nr:hypothetical protein [Dolichospermum sp. UHCC 0259]MTJ49604.1 hypothetical protein [Dolichospermum sp. UHCC 0259]
MLKIRTFILAITLTPLLAINWQQAGQSQTSPSVGTAGSMSGAPGPINTSPSVGTAGGMSGGGNTSTSGNTISNPNPSVGNAGGQSGAGNGTGNNGNPDDNTSPSVGNAGGQSGAGNGTGNNGNPDDNTSPSVGNAGGQSGAGNGTGNNGNPDDNTSPSVGNAGGQSGAGNGTGNNGNPGDNSNPSVGNAGGQSGAGSGTGNNANNGGDTGTENNGGDTDTANNGGDTGTENNGGDTDTGNNNEEDNDNPSGPVENLAPRASSIRIVRTPRGNIIRIKIEAQKQINEVALNLLNSNNSGVLVALVQGGSTGQIASDNLINFLNSAGVNTDLGNNLREILSRIVSNQGNVDVDINQLNNAINTYNQIIQEGSPVTLQALSQNRDFVEIGRVLKELRKAVN